VAIREEGLLSVDIREEGLGSVEIRGNELLKEAKDY
jgi:hypothetical protein